MQFRSNKAKTLGAHSEASAGLKEMSSPKKHTMESKIFNHGSIDSFKSCKKQNDASENQDTPIMVP